MIEALHRLSVAPPEGGEAYNRWLEQADAIAFLKENLVSDDIVIYAGLPHTFIHAILMPRAAIEPPDVDALLSWNGNPYSSWGMTTSGSDVWIDPPLADFGKAFSKGEQIVFCRSFEGVPDRANYIEILQKFIHVSSLHFMPDRNAWCRLDQYGDIDNLLSIKEFPRKGEYSGGTIVTCDREILREYAALTDTVLLQMFDFTRYRIGKFGGWKHPIEEQKYTDQGIFYRFHIEQNHASYSRGIQIADIATSKETIVKLITSPSDEATKQYEKFLAFDWKNKRTEEISCSPSRLANYFTKSDLPFEVTPAFFRSEVLSKYKADKEKYTLRDRSISCRGAWHLQTYDINEAGQVHTYLIYLSHLPHYEQLHWKQFNEEPKAPISKRAFTTDLEGDFYADYDPLPSLKGKLLDLQDRDVPWWTLRAEDLPARVNYPVTVSADEWAEEILCLDQLLVEGFEEKWLRNKAHELGRSPKKRFRSLKLIEECLSGCGCEEDQAYSIMSPIHDLHNLRNETKGHASDKKGRAIRSRAVKDHGSLIQHFKDLSAGCDDALGRIIEIFDESGLA